MALQIWCPFTEDFKNQGVYGVELIKSGTASITSGGKLGNCLSNTNGYFTFADKNFPTSVGFTCCAWVYITNLNKTNGLVSNKDSGPVFSECCIINGKLEYWHYDGSWKTKQSSGTLSANTWYHVAFVINGTSIKFYINGNLDSETTGTTNSNNALNLICKSYAANTEFSGKINDFRLYNNPLTPQEVKELSKGLVLHYPLNDTLVLTNAFNYPTFNTSAASGGWSHWGPSGATASWSLNTNKDYIFNKNNTYSHKFLHTGGSYYIVYQSPAFEGGYRSAQAIIKMEGGEYPHNISFGQNATVGTNPPTTFTALGGGFYLMKHEGFRQNGSDDLVSIYINNNVTVYISEAYLENDRQVCSNLFKTTNVVYDSSGYNNNGTITGTLTTSTDTPRYDKCTLFGNGTKITPPIFPSFLTNEATVSMWVKLDQLPPSSPGRTMLYTAWYGFSCEITSSGQTYFRTYLTSGSVDSPYGTMTTGNWIHWVGVKSSTGVLLYLNGTLIGTTTNSNNFNWSSNVNNSIACYSGSYFLYGKLSDIRLYSTALSADDIKALYQEAAFIDHKGNIGCYLFYEDADSQITKTGQVKTEEFEEISDLTDGVAKVYELKIECNQLIEI